MEIGISMAREGNDGSPGRLGSPGNVNDGSAIEGSNEGSVIGISIAKEGSDGRLGSDGRPGNVNDGRPQLTRGLPCR